MNQLETPSEGLSTTTSTTPRHEAQIGSGLSSGRNLTVVNLLLALVVDKETVIRIDDAEYVRAAPRRKDPRIVKTGDDRYVIVNGVRSSKERFNFSLQGDQTVLVGPEAGKQGRPQSRLVIRAYNVIRDGELVMPSIEAILSQRLFALLQEAGRLSLDGVTLEAQTVHEPSVYYTIRLEGMRLISSDWARPEQQKLAERLKNEEDLSFTLTALAARRLELVKEGVTSSLGPSSRSPSTSSLPYYHPKVTSEEEPTETYEAKRVQYELEGYNPKSLDTNVYTDLVMVTKAERATRRELALLRFGTRAICFAIESCTSGTPIVWSDPLKSRKTKYLREVRKAVLDGVVIVRTVSRLPVSR